jgi:hypothetical protein
MQKRINLIYRLIDALLFIYLFIYLFNTTPVGELPYGTSKKTTSLSDKAR